MSEQFDIITCASFLDLRQATCMHIGTNIITV